MRFKRATTITVDCFSNVFKLVLYRVVTGVIFYSLVYLILTFGLSFIVKSAEFQTLTGLVKEFFRALALSLTGGDASALTEFQTNFHSALLAFGSLLVANMGNIVGSVIGVCLMYLLQRIVNGIAQFAIAGIINDRMSSYAQTRFAVSYFRNLPRAALYQLVYVPLAFVYDVLSLAACWFLFFYMPSLLPSFGVLSVIVSVAFTMTAILVLQAVKLTFISAWMPAMIEGKKSVLGALKETMACRKDFARRLGGFLVACYLIVFVNVGFAFFTAGSGLLLTIPLSFLFLIVMQFVNYYETKGMKYFVAKDVISGPDDEKIDHQEN